MPRKPRRPRRYRLVLYVAGQPLPVDRFRAAAYASFVGLDRTRAGEADAWCVRRETPLRKSPAR